METNTIIKAKVIYSILMALFTTAVLITTLMMWYKADKSARWCLFIPIIAGYTASILMFIYRKPLNVDWHREYDEAIAYEKDMADLIN